MVWACDEERKELKGEEKDLKKKIGFD